MFGKNLSLSLMICSVLLIGFWSALIAQGREHASGVVDSLPTIAGVVWNDQNNNDIRDGESAVANVDIYLRDHEKNFITSTTSDISGTYQLTLPTSGTYFVEFVNPPEMNLTTINQELSQQLDLQHTTEGLMAGPINLLSSTTMISINVGYIFPPRLEVEVSAANVSTWSWQTQPVTYAISITNRGTGPAYEADLRIAVPQYTVAFLAQSTSDWLCEGEEPGAICEIEIGTLDPGDSYQADLAVGAHSTLPAEVTEIVFDTFVEDAFSQEQVCGGGCGWAYHVLPVPSMPIDINQSHDTYLPIMTSVRRHENFVFDE